MQRHSSSLFWWIVAGLTVITIAVSAYLFFSQHLSQPINPVAQATHPLEATATQQQPSSETIATESEFKPTANKVLVEESLRHAAVPENSSLAHEEIAKQEDIQQQLIQQEGLLQQQHLTADELIQLKEQQIKLLEQQLAALKD
jgi:hypothetical protein